MAEIDEKQLLSALKKGDKESFRIIFERNYPLFCSFAKRLLRDDDVAEDVVQNVFMRLWVYRERIDENRNLRSYLLVSVRNEIYSHFRSAFVARREDDIHAVAGQMQCLSDFEADYHADEMEHNIDRIVGKMPPRRREIFNMSRKQHLSNGRIAQRLDLSVRTVEKHLELALAEIRRTLRISMLILIGII